MLAWFLGLFHRRHGVGIKNAHLLAVSIANTDPKSALR